MLQSIALAKMASQRDEIATKLNALEKTLAGMSYLCVEASEYSWRTINSMKPDTFEGFTSRNFKGRFVYLDENTDYADALKIQGMSPSLFGMMQMLTIYRIFRPPVLTPRASS